MLAESGLWVALAVHSLTYQWKLLNINYIDLAKSKSGAPLFCFVVVIVFFAGTY